MVRQYVTSLWSCLSAVFSLEAAGRCPKRSISPSTLKGSGKGKTVQGRRKTVRRLQEVRKAVQEGTVQGKGSAKKSVLGPRLRQPDKESKVDHVKRQQHSITAARRPTGPNKNGPHKQLLLGSVRGPPQVGAPAPVVVALAVASVSVLRGPLVGAAAVPVHSAAASRRL